MNGESYHINIDFNNYVFHVFINANLNDMILGFHYCQVLYLKIKKYIYIYIKRVKFTNTIQKTSTIIMSFNFDISKKIKKKKWIYLKNLQSYLVNYFLYTTELTQKIASIIYFIYNFSWITTSFEYDF